MDSDKSGAGLVLPVLVALCGSLLGRNMRGGMVVVGSLNLGGSVELLPNAIRIAELAVDKQAQTLLLPVSVSSHREVSHFFHSGEPPWNGRSTGSSSLFRAQGNAGLSLASPSPPTNAADLTAWGGRTE